MKPTDKDRGMDKNRRKRLDELSKQWDELDFWRLGRLSLADLRLLLEHFAPLRALIRSVLDAPNEEQPGERDQARVAQLEAEPAQARGHLDKLQNQLEDMQRQLKSCQSEHDRLAQDERQHRQQLFQLEEELRQTKSALEQAEREAAMRHMPELAILRQDAELLRRMELTDLPANNTQALVQVVAVLSQYDSLLRLWDHLKERCESENRPITDKERAVLEAALSWHNHNWRKRPYRLIEAAPMMAYDFERHQRSRNTPTGETLRATLLPGIVDGSDKIIRKIMVSTQ
ncbi:MAG: hypothetical protein K6346_05310 [Halothiobacillaceae bacterium]